jgi:hypothetical protein
MNKRRNHSLSELAEAAFEQVAAEVIERAKQTGTPVIIWEDGRIKAVPPEALEPAIKGSLRKKNQARRRGRPRRTQRTDSP